MYFDPPIPPDPIESRFNRNDFPVTSVDDLRTGCVPALLVFIVVGACIFNLDIFILAFFIIIPVLPVLAGIWIAYGQTKQLYGRMAFVWSPLAFIFLPGMRERNGFFVISYYYWIISLSAASTCIVWRFFGWRLSRSLFHTPSEEPRTQFSIRDGLMGTTYLAVIVFIGRRFYEIMQNSGQVGYLIDSTVFCMVFAVTHTTAGLFGAFPARSVRWIAIACALTVDLIYMFGFAGFYRGFTDVERFIGVLVLAYGNLMTIYGTLRIRYTGGLRWFRIESAMHPDNPHGRN